MTLPDTLTLAEQRDELRRQLREQRALIVKQLGPEPHPDAVRFPRSATMRFLTGRAGFGMLSQIASWKMGSHPGMMIAAQAATRYFLKRKRSSSDDAE